MSALSGKTILLVEDEVDLREILSDELESQHALVLSAENGKEASEIFKSRPIDLVISDIRMAGGSGIDLLDQIKSTLVDKPQVVMVTGFSDLPIEEVYHRGASMVFIKPFDLGNLVAALENMVTPIDERKGKLDLKIKKSVILKVDNLESFQSEVGFKFGKGGFFLEQSYGQFRIGDAINFKIEFTKGSELSFEGVAVCRWVRNEFSKLGGAGAGFEIIELSRKAVENFNKIKSVLQSPAFIPRG